MERIAPHHDTKHLIKLLNHVKEIKYKRLNEHINKNYGLLRSGLSNNSRIPFVLESYRTSLPPFSEYAKYALEISKGDLNIGNYCVMLPVV
jgi:hypothetical protein